MNFWVKNSIGKEDAMLTFATISFFVITISIILASISEINVGGFKVNFIPLDSGLASIYLGATFTAYVTRKWTDKKYDKNEKNKPSEDKDIIDQKTEIVSVVSNFKKDNKNEKK